jgi:hypothetical protein
MGSITFLFCRTARQGHAVCFSAIQTQSTKPSSAGISRRVADIAAGQIALDQCFKRQQALYFLACANQAWSESPCKHEI